jgi:hypothetical protein
MSTARATAVLRAAVAANDSRETASGSIRDM